jgi:hypothetical protein
MQGLTHPPEEHDRQDKLQALPLPVLQGAKAARWSPDRADRARATDDMEFLCWIGHRWALRGRSDQCRDPTRLKDHLPTVRQIQVSIPQCNTSVNFEDVVVPDFCFPAKHQSSTPHLLSCRIPSRKVSNHIL